jgi:hypothetical protein
MIAMMLIGMMQPAGQVVTIPDRQTLTLPNEIAPALFPYLACMLQDRNSRIPGAQTGDAARAGIEQLRTDCQPDRDKAEARAREMLRTSNMPDTDRKALITSSLRSIDHSRDNIAQRLDQANSVKKQAID